MAISLHPGSRKFKLLCDILIEFNEREELIFCKTEVLNQDDTVYVHIKDNNFDFEKKYVVSRIAKGNFQDDFISASPAATIIQSLKELNSNTVIHVRRTENLLIDHKFMFDILPNGDDLVSDLLFHPNPESNIQKLFLPLIGFFWGLLLFIYSTLTSIKLKIILAIVTLFIISIPSIIAQRKYKNLA